MNKTEILIAKAQRIATAFTRILNRWLKPGQMRLVRSRNRREKNPGICHTHDFYDTNMAMAEAFTKVMHRKPRPQSKADAALWSRAWRTAQRAEFRAK